MGITYTTILDNIEIINYKKKCQELESRIKQWQKRKISVLGKITVVKTLLVPILTHLFIAIPKPDQSIIKKLEGLLFQYIWNGRDRVSRVQMIQDSSNGGCNMIDLNSFIKSLKITWIRRILNNNTAWKNLLASNIDLDENKLFLFGNAYIADLKKKNKKQIGLRFLTHSITGFN